MTVGEQAGNGSVTRSGINRNQSQTTKASRPTSKQTCEPYNHATLQADRRRMDFSGRAIQAAENVMMNITKSQLPQTAYCCCMGIVDRAVTRSCRELRLQGGSDMCVPDKCSDEQLTSHDQHACQRHTRFQAQIATQQICHSGLILTRKRSTSSGKKSSCHNEQAQRLVRELGDVAWL